MSTAQGLPLGPSTRIPELFSSTLAPDAKSTSSTALKSLKFAPTSSNFPPVMQAAIANVPASILSAMTE